MGPGNSGFATSLGLLLLRLALKDGFLFSMGRRNCLGRLMGRGWRGFAEVAAWAAGVFAAWIAWAYMNAIGEFAGGISVLLGLLTRLGVIPIMVSMLVAIATVHGKNGFAAQKGGFEFPFACLMMAGTLMLTGAGLVSADAKLFPARVTAWK